MVIIVLRIYALHEYKLYCKYFRFAVYRVITLQAVAKWVKAATRVDDVSELLSELQMTGCKCYCRVYVCVSLVPRPFLVGEVRKGRGRKEWITQPQRRIHGISLMFNNLWTHEYLQVYRTHFKREATCPLTQKFFHDSHLLDIRVFPHQRWQQECSRGFALVLSY